MNEDQTAKLTALGYLGIFGMSWMISMIFAGWFGQTIPYVGYLVALILGGGLPILAGVLIYSRGKPLDTLIFLAFGTFSTILGVYGVTIDSTLMEVSSGYDGWINLILTVFFASLWLATSGQDAVRKLLLLTLALTFLTHAIGHWTNIMVIFLIAGYIGLINGLVAGYISVSDLFNALENRETAGYEL